MGSGQLILRLSPDSEDQDVSYRVGDPVGLKDQDALGQEDEAHRKQEVGKTGGKKEEEKPRKHGTFRRKWTESNKQETGSRNDSRSRGEEEGKTKTESNKHTRKQEVEKKHRKNTTNSRKQGTKRRKYTASR